jgi:hypothetical protein
LRALHRIESDQHHDKHHARSRRQRIGERFHRVMRLLVRGVGVDL